MKKDGKSTDKYTVGYGKPPASGQFKPGQSGNPGGKKKGKGLAHFLAELGETEKTFLQGGKAVTKQLNEGRCQRNFLDAG